MLMREKEIDHIETAGDLRATFADVPDTMPLRDCFGEGLLAVLHEDEDGTKYVTIR